MTQDIGPGRINHFQYTVQDTIELGEQRYLQTLHDSNSDTYAIQIRENGRYSHPVELTHKLETEPDLEQLLQNQDQETITELLQPEVEK